MNPDLPDGQVQVLNHPAPHEPNYWPPLPTALGVLGQVLLSQAFPESPAVPSRAGLHAAFFSGREFINRVAPKLQAQSLTLVHAQSPLGNTSPPWACFPGMCQLLPSRLERHSSTSRTPIFEFLGSPLSATEVSHGAPLGLPSSGLQDSELFWDIMLC